MKIKKIKINHYKSIKEPVIIENISDLNILVGPNNAGKTNILDAVNLFFQKDLDQERFFDKRSDIEITIQGKEKEHLLSLKSGEFSGIEELQKEEFFIRISEKAEYNDIKNEFLFFKENYYNEYNRFTKLLKKNFKDVDMSEQLFFESTNQDNDRQKTFKRMGEGFKRLFVILFYAFNPQYKIIFIDEPETHLHPSVVKRFLMILESENTNNQIFITTHHRSLIDARHFQKIWRVSRNENRSTVVHRINKNKIDTNRLIQEINDDNSGMLFAEKVLLLEGVSDRIFMREMINRFYEKNKDIKIVYTGGKGCIDLYADVCELFNIPYAVMLDHDAINSPSLQRIKKFPHFSKRTSLQEKINQLKEKEIFILEKDLERVYPRKYRYRETKPLTALYVSKKITREDLESREMKVIRDILERI